MTDLKKYRIADSVVTEPLIDRFMAWSFPYAPATAGLHLRHYQLPVLRDYLRQPEWHVKACRNPELVGGPFVDIPVARADEVAGLLRRLETERGEHLRFAEQLAEFQNLIATEARGQSLEPFYARVPPALKGFVELAYDYRHRATVLLLEGLLYTGRTFEPGLQSLDIFDLSKDEDRPFFMSTPRLESRDRLSWRVPFHKPEVDAWFGLDLAPRPLGEIREWLGLPAGRESELLPFLDERPRPRSHPWQGDRVRLRYFGHACVLTEWQGAAVLTDPFVAVHPSAGGISRYSFGDLPQTLDYALVTHNHADHFLFETLIRLRHRVSCLVVPKSHGYLHGDLSLKLLARKLGFPRVEELAPMESLPLPDGEITAIPFLGEHGDLGHGKTVYVLRAGGHRILFGADTNCLEPAVYREVHRCLGPIHTVFLGTECEGAPLEWTYGSLFPEKLDRRLSDARRQRGSDAAGAMRLLETLGARRFYNYGMGLEPWMTHVLALVPDPASPQMKESDRLLAMARAAGFEAAERLCGRAEILLDPHPPRPKTLSRPAVPDAEDQFVF